MNEYLVGDIVWAKLMGYPWWPAKVVDEKSLNKRVLAAKPKGSSTVWPVLFFGSFDYGWFGQENLCYFDEGLAEHGSLNRRGNLFARAVKQAQAPQSFEESEESDEKPAKQSAKRSTRPGSQNVPKDSKRNASAAPKEKKAKIDKEPSDPASSDLSNSNHSSPVRHAQTKRSRPALSRSSKENASNKVLKPVSEDLTEKVPEHSASETIAKSSPPPPKSPLPKSPKPQHQSVKEEEQDVPEDVLEMRALRASLQKATISGNYKNPELVDQILTTLENGVFSSQCLLAAKMAKLMRHLHTRPIPKNSYKFYERIRILGIRFKAAIESKSTDLLNESKDSESSTVQPLGKKLKSLSKNTKPSSSIDPASDRDSETDNSQKKELDEAILNLLSESTEKDDNDDYSEKKATKKLNSYNSKADSSPTSNKHATENADSSGFLESANDSKELDNSKSEGFNEINPPNHQSASKVINSQASSPIMDSTLEPIDDNDATNPDDVLKPESNQTSSKIAKESVNSLQGSINNQGQQKVTLDENLSGESNLDNLSDSVPLSSKNVASETELANNTDSETITAKHESDLEKMSSDHTLKNNSSAQNLDGVPELSDEQAISPTSSQNKDHESCSNQEQVSPDEAKVDIPHDAEKEASTVSPPSLASPVAERASITADSPTSRATVASL